MLNNGVKRLVNEKFLLYKYSKQKAGFAYKLKNVDTLRFDYLKNKIFRTKIFKISCAIVIADKTSAYPEYYESVQLITLKIGRKYNIFTKKCATLQS